MTTRPRYTVTLVKHIYTVEYLGAAFVVRVWW